MNIITNDKEEQLDFNFLQEVKKRSCQPIDLCYQCQKCAAGCQVASYTDFRPNQIIRLIQFGLKDEALKSSAIWLCVNCETCGARCPNGISISAVTDTLREMALEEKVPASVKNVPLFHKAFLDSVKSGGRVHEPTMLLRYKLKSGNLFEDMKMGLDLFKKGKLPLFPSRTKHKDAVKKIFERVKKTDFQVCGGSYDSASIEERG
ncbi:MAG: 4Fe-4S dicluster domain-containing protein [Desulfotomaculum sp.]|nr:4Fe-4S dicluster domain-containing protein [Desulfotomaculum sp.]